VKGLFPQGTLIYIFNLQGLDCVEPKPSSGPIKPAATPGKPASTRPEKGKKARFKDKEEYFAWAEKRKEKLRRKAAVRAARREKLSTFFRTKAYLKKRFIISWTLTALGAVLLFLYLTKSGEVDSWTPQKMPAVEQMNTPLSPLGSGSSDTSTPGNGRKLYSVDDLLPQARKIMVLVKTPLGSGSGFFLPHPGVVATSAHLLEGKEEAEVHLSNGAIRKGVVLKKLPMPLDVAFLQIQDFGLEGVPFANSDQCQDGEEAVAMGIPGRDTWSPDLVVVKGKILRCYVPSQGAQYLQMNLDLHPATVGGPIFNAWGDIVGISKGELEGSGLGGARYGLAINMVKGFMDQRLYRLEQGSREREQFFKYVYDYLWSGLIGSHQAYQKKLYDLYQKGALSGKEAARMDQKGLQPPVGYSSMKNWVAELTEKVVRGEITKEKAAAQIRSHFEL
jgi:S1-C subfamily serine protease